MWLEMLDQQRLNLLAIDMRAFRYTERMKDFWAEIFMLAGTALCTLTCTHARRCTRGGDDALFDRDRADSFR